MKTDVQTPMEVFHLPQYLEIPLFQRPYVWSEDDQWTPLWQDVRRLADRQLSDPYSDATHFLGAVVIQAHEAQHGRIPASNIIDGQQRLTTLQILMDAAEMKLDEVGLDSMSAQLQLLTRNQTHFLQSGESSLKLRHTNRDRDAFGEVMNAEPPVEYRHLQHSGSLLVKAHEYFAGAIGEWLGDPNHEGLEKRGTALVSVLSRGLQLVVINLAASENSQEIFETLNARGTPLTAADLIKNFVFQRLTAEGFDTKKAFLELWPFDTKFWESEVSAGRYRLSRSSLFLSQWLISRLGEEISPLSTFSRFKSYVEHESGRTMTDLLHLITEQAKLYESWTIAASNPDRQLSRVEMAVYRMKANESELLKPLLIWLHSTERQVPQDVIEQVIAISESWVVRRQLLRLTGSDLVRVVADIIRINRDTPPAELPVRVQSHLSNLNVASTYWPGDDEIRHALTTDPVYRRYRRGRLRMLLESIEDRFRAQTNQPQVPRRNYPIEHVLPQKWETSWPVEGLEAEQDRAAHVHRLGNLTLLTKSLNSKVSNGPWETKRDALNSHDTLLLNSRLLKVTDASIWGEELIDERTLSLVDQVLSIWPVPEGHTGEILDATPKESEYVEIKDLVAAGLLVPGTRLIPRQGQWSNNVAIVREDGLIEIDGNVFETPSGAGKYVRNSSTNGWYFWRLEDGRNLKDVRSVYRGSEPTKSDSFDWSTLHTLLEALPEGNWASYGNLASVIGTAAQPLGNHVASCKQCANAHRVLMSDGRVSSEFAWVDPSDMRNPLEMLRAEGIAIVDGKADRDKELSSDQLAALITDDADE